MKNSLRPRRLCGESEFGGFTFLEVLFSVIIIGVGVIMIAGVFPVALQQSQQNLAESAAVPMSRDALREIQAVASGYLPQTVAPAPYVSMFPPTYNPALGLPTPYAAHPVMPISNMLHSTNNAFAFSTLLYAPTATPTITAPNYPYLANSAVLAAPGAQVQSGDHRYGWVSFYRRDWNQVNGQPVPAPYAQVWIITAQSTAEGQQTYSAPPNVSRSNLIAATVANTSTFGSIIQLPSRGTPAAPNAYALIIDDQPASGSNTTTDANLIGQVVRLGTVAVANTNSNFWYLLPGSDLDPNDTLLNNGMVTGVAPSATLTGGEKVQVFILGSPPTVPYGSLFNGPAQDLTCTSGFIRVGN